MFRSLLSRIDVVLVQAVIAGALSFAHLHDLAEAAGQDGWKAWAYPVSVDLLFIAAWRRMRTLRADHQLTRSVWTWFVIALAASLGANIATAGLLDLRDVPDWLRIVVAGWPALAFLGGTLMAHGPAQQTAPEPVDAPSPEPVTVERAPEPQPVELPAPASETEEDPAADEPSPEPVAAPVPPQSAPAAPAVPPALLDHARKIADTHQATTGSAIDADTLRARLGVPPVLADAITAQLA